MKKKIFFSVFKFFKHNIFNKIIALNLVFLSIIGFSIQFTSLGVNSESRDFNSPQLISKDRSGNEIWQIGSEKINVSGLEIVTAQNILNNQNSRSQNNTQIKPQVIWKPVIVTGVVIVAVKKIVAATGLKWGVPFFLY
jgi:uncharacterized protein YuzE